MYMTVTAGIIDNLLSIQGTTVYNIMHNYAFSVNCSFLFGSVFRNTWPGVRMRVYLSILSCYLSTLG